MEKRAEKQFLSYGFTGEDFKYQNKFHAEDTLVELIKEKSGLIDKNSTIRTLTNMKENTIEFQLHYEYRNNRDEFVNAMKIFLNSAVKKDLNLSYQIKETMRFIKHYPVLTMNRTHLKDLIDGLKSTQPQSLNTEILKGDLRIHHTVCFPFGH